MRVVPAISTSIPIWSHSALIVLSQSVQSVFLNSRTTVQMLDKQVVNNNFYFVSWSKSRRNLFGQLMAHDLPEGAEDTQVQGVGYKGTDRV